MASRGRPAIYTPEEVKARATQRHQDWNQINTSCTNIRMIHADKARYAAFAKSQGLPLASMFRAAAERWIVDEGWVWDGEGADPGNAGDEQG